MIQPPPPATARFDGVELWFDWSIDTWPLVMALLVGLGCGLLGAVFLLRRNALLGDAVSHSVLPGVAGGLFISGLIAEHGERVFGASVGMLFVLAGALAAGLLSTALIETFHRYSRIRPDTALGAVFPAFFAAGILLIEVAARGAHFDIDCVFYGSLEVIGELDQVVPTLAATLLVLTFFTLAHKELLITSFDSALARSLGLRVGSIHRALILLLTLTVVSAFEAVGAILVIAFLIIPPATAYLLVRRFHHMLWLSAGLGVSAAFLGSWLTIVLANFGFETARAPTAAVTAGLQFLVALVASPRDGLAVAFVRRRHLRRRIAEENLLASVYRLARPSSGWRVSIHDAAAPLGGKASALRPALAGCLARGELSRAEGPNVVLTEAGREKVEAIIRAHRLWESYMMEHMGAAADHVHDAADRIEHHLDSALVKELEASLGYPRADPHGRTIPEGRS